MVNKKGYLKTIEAVIAILIILGFIYVITPKQHLQKETTPQSVESAEEFIINQALYNSTYRNCIVLDDRSCIDVLIKKNTPFGYNYQFEMCDSSTSCLQQLGITLPVDKSIYSKNVFISQEKGLISPKVFRIYMWEGKVGSTLSCTDDCAVEAKECYNINSFRECGQYDKDACLDWNIVNCDSGKTCSNGQCICIPSCDWSSITDKCQISKPNGCGGTCTRTIIKNSLAPNADTNCDGYIDRNELGEYVLKWIRNEITRDDLGKAIQAWVGGLK